MPFEFIGNPEVVRQLRQLAAAAAPGRAQRTLLLSGPRGIGKTTLAVNFGLALNCRNPPEPGVACGACASCRQAAPGVMEARAQLLEEALAYRAAEVKSAARQQAPLRLALHPSIHLFPPDGDGLTMAQARVLRHQDALQASLGQSWVLIVPDFDQARWAVQAALLKTLEEPAAGVVLVLLARNPGAVLAAVRSRALEMRLAPVPLEELAAALVARGRTAEAAGLAARLAQGAPGRALALDVAAYRQVREEALHLLNAGLKGAPAAEILRISESTRASKEKFESLLEILYSVLQDIAYLQAEFSRGIGNVDCLPELRQLAQRIAPPSVPEMVAKLDRIQAAARRNSFRPLALASWALALTAAQGPGRRRDVPLGAGEPTHGLAQ
ncbi:MAG: AAA family ATPase [Terriglobales bacterium]